MTAVLPEHLAVPGPAIEAGQAPPTTVEPHVLDDSLAPTYCGIGGRAMDKIIQFSEPIIDKISAGRFVGAFDRSLRPERIPGLGRLFCIKDQIKET